MTLEDFINNYIQTINETPFLLSVLYDVNLLPEQITTHREAYLMAAIVESYSVGVDDGYSMGRAE